MITKYIPVEFVVAISLINSGKIIYHHEACQIPEVME